ncbi:hypothetical protein SEUCBS139899_002565 [Sporothrix eucalyptigena]
MPVAAPGAPRAATARLRRTAALPPPTTANKRTRLPTADSSTLASSPLPRPTGDSIVVPDGSQRSPTKRSRTTVETPTAPATPTNCGTTLIIPATPTGTTNTWAVQHTTGPFTTTVPEDVIKICDPTRPARWAA